jgi:cytoplasmic iron level regulating protein YaaA (DUF328/UPF0246 family)
MARFVVENRVTDMGALHAFQVGGYEFQPAQSDDSTVVFSRDI